MALNDDLNSLIAAAMGIRFGPIGQQMADIASPRTPPSAFIPGPSYRITATMVSQLPTIIGALKVAGPEIARSTSEAIAAEAKLRVPVDSGDLRDAIHVEQINDDTYSVVAGNEDVFYGHMVEFGSSHGAAQPFLIPAVESVRAGVGGAAIPFVRGAA